MRDNNGNNNDNGNFDDIHKKYVDENLYGNKRKSKTLEPKGPKRRRIIFNGI